METQFTIRCELVDLTDEQKRKLDNLMRVFQSSLRYAYNRLLEGKQAIEVVKQLQRVFIPNWRYSESAVMGAMDTIRSQKRLLPFYIRDIEHKLRKSKQKLEFFKNPLKRRGIGSRIEKLEQRRAKYKQHLEDETLPKIVFGSRAYLKRLHEWTLPQISWNPMKQMSEWLVAASAEVKASVF